MKKVITVVLILLQLGVNANIYRLEPVHYNNDEIEYTQTYALKEFLEYRIIIDAPYADLTTGVFLNGICKAGSTDIGIDSIVPSVLRDGSNLVKLFISDSMYNTNLSENIEIVFSLDYYAFNDTMNIIHDQYTVLKIDTLMPDTIGIQIGEDYISSVKQGDIYAVPADAVSVTADKLTFISIKRNIVFKPASIYYLKCFMNKKYSFSTRQMMLTIIGSSCISGCLFTSVIQSMFEPDDVPFRIGAFGIMVIGCAFMAISAILPSYNYHIKDKEQVDNFNEKISPKLILKEIEM